MFVCVCVCMFVCVCACVCVCVCVCVCGGGGKDERENGGAIKKKRKKCEGSNCFVNHVISFLVIQACARDEILANGGSISHHHGGKTQNKQTFSFCSTSNLVPKLTTGLFFSLNIQI